MFDAVFRFFFEWALWQERRRKAVEDQKDASRRALQEEIEAAEKRKREVP